MKFGFIIFIYYVICTSLFSQDYNWYSLSDTNDISDYHYGIETAYLEMYCPPGVENWEERGGNGFNPQYHLHIEFIHDLEGLYWGRFVPLMVLNDTEIAGSYMLIDEPDKLAYVMEILTGDHITRVTLQAYEHTDFKEMTKHWLNMVSSVRYKDDGPYTYVEYMLKRFPESEYLKRQRAREEALNKERESMP